MTRTYTNRADAISREIIDPLSASEFPLTDWDIDAIADEVLGGHEEGYACRVSADEFWDIARKHDRTLQ